MREASSNANHIVGSQTRDSIGTLCRDNQGLIAVSKQLEETVSFGRKSGIG